MRYRIDDSHPSVAAVLERAGDLQTQVKAMLRVIEETVPIQRIWLDTAENKETPRTGFAGEPSSAVIEVASVLLNDLIERKGLTACLLDFTFCVAQAGCLDFNTFFRIV